MIVDDSVVVRRIVSGVLSDDPALEVVGYAVNGRVALVKLPLLDPDIVILDLEMPEMDGLETLAAIRRIRPRLPVVMYSSLTQRGAVATLDALALGASDYLTKPSGVESPDHAIQRIRDELIPTVKTFCRSLLSRPTFSPSPALARLRAASLGAVPVFPFPSLSPSPPARSGVFKKVEVVAIGTSTGGPNALAEVIPAFPADFPVPVVIVQHMPPIFTKMLAERLSTKSAIHVCEATHGEPLLPGRAYVAPGNYHMHVVRDHGQARILLDQAPQENSCRPAVDVLFRTTAAAFPGGTLAVIMTGIGQDGLRGCEKVREAGGVIYAQDEATSVVWGMPGSVVKAGLSDRVLPIDLIGQAVVSRTLEGRVTPAAVRH
jgi:two-component system chemotaxis response regulator CheB